MSKFYSYLKRTAAGSTFFAFFTFALLFLAGITIGACIALKAPAAELNQFSANVIYSAKHSTDNTLKTITDSALSVFILLSLIWTGGFFSKIPTFCITGSAVVFKGAVTGYTVGMLSRIYALKGICLAALTILPQYMVLLPLMFGLGAAAFNFSLSGTAIEKKKNLKKYLLLPLISALLSALVGFLDGFVSGKSMHYFI